MKTIAMHLVTTLLVAVPTSSQQAEDVAVRFTHLRPPLAANGSLGAFDLLTGISPFSPTLSQLSVDEAFCCNDRRWLTGVTELLTLQVVPWYFNRHVADDSTAVLDIPQSWWENIDRGVEWDPNNFITNLFMHPYHGNVYFNSARTNGFNYWESMVASAVGSLLWEFFGEINRPAINDLLNTSLGGGAIGEATYRAFNALVDNEMTGPGRTVREGLGFLLNPVGALNRLFRGEMTREGGNLQLREDLRSKSSVPIVRLGVRATGEPLPDREREGPFYEIEYRYGDPFDSTVQWDPFDAFQMVLQFHRDSEFRLGRFQVEGTLLRKRLADGLMLTLNHHYDYVSTEAGEIGGQSVSPTIMLRRNLFGRFDLNAKLQPTAAIISAVTSPRAERGYDFGSGVGLRAFAAVNYGVGGLVTAYYIKVRTYTLSGADGHHDVRYFGIRSDFPSSGPVGFGVEYLESVRNSHYRDFRDLVSRDAQFRFYARIRP